MKVSFVLLIVTAVLLALAFQAAHLPAVWLFGPLVASALFAVRDWKGVELPRSVYIAAQAVIGTALGAGFSPATLLTLPRHIWIFTFAVLFILLTSLFNGWLLTRCTRLDVPTAFLGTMPGGAGEMVAMSDSLRADTRLVVIMQYTRLLLILASLAVIAPLLSHFSHLARMQPVADDGTPSATFGSWKTGILLLLTFVGWLTGMRTRIPAGTFLIPTLLYFLLQLSGLRLERWPWPIFAVAYLVIGLQIGGRFRPSTLAAIKDILVPVCATTLLLLAGSFALAWVLALEMGLDPMSAYLAATPGGLDSVAAVATEVHGDTAIILTVHLVRLVCVLIAAPWLVRACSRWLTQARAREDRPSSVGGV
jgi:membrane AbrB-like protein